MCHISYWFWSWHMVLPCVLYSLFFNHFRNQALGGGLHVWVSRRSPSPSSARHNTYYFHSFSISIHTWPYSNPSWSCMSVVSSELIFPPTSTSASALSLLRLRKTLLPRRELCKCRQCLLQLGHELVLSLHHLCSSNTSTLTMWMMTYQGNDEQWSKSYDS